MVAEIIVNSIAKSLNKTFDYIIPDHMLKDIKVGSRVLVPFGKSKVVEGFVINIKQQSKFANKEIQKIEDTLLDEKSVNLAKIMARRYFCNISDCIKLMLPPGSGLAGKVKDKTANFVYLKRDIEEIEFLIETERIKSEKQIRVVKFLIENEGIRISDLELITDVNRGIIKTLEKNGHLEIVEEKVERNPFINRKINRDRPLKLTEEQQIAYDKIKESNYKEFLLFGVTGSGKTEIYLQLIQNVLDKGKTAIVLVPEISLTPQMTDRFLARFGDIIAVLHSKLSIGERYDQWQKIKQGKSKIVIGARSAIFAPIQDLGIIIIDEEHDSSYKSDMAPRFNAKEIARYLAKENNIPLVLGSATPEINTYYQAKTDKMELIKLSKRANKSNLPDIEIVDLKQELANGNRSILSEKLYQSIKQNIEDKKQTILFLNRRGFSTFVMCRECGYTAKCKRCNISLTYHQKENKLKCHYCGYEIENLKLCPKCNSKKIKYFGAGTQKIEDFIQKEFPKATTIRMDIDTVSKKNSHEEILNQFKNENIDILIGTQMVVKGHHFPNVTLVGVVSADTALNSGDYRSNERTFDLLVQVAGRAGRENLPGKVIMQTYSPEDFCIECSKNQDYELFYETEIALRKQLKYPPFCDIIMFAISSADKEEVIKSANNLYKLLCENNTGDMLIFKPVPAPIDKIKNRYRWRIIAKCKLSSNIINMINNTLEKYYKLNFKKTKITVDTNPNNMG